MVDVVNCSCGSEVILGNICYDINHRIAFASMNSSDEVEIDKHCDELFAFSENFSPGISLEGLCACFRYLRNACALSRGHQDYIVNHGKGLPCIAKLVGSVIETIPISEERNICIRLGVQLLGNLTVNNEKTKVVVWERCRSILSASLSCGDQKCANYCAMVVYNIFLGKLEEEPCKDLDLGFLNGLVTAAVHGSEYGLVNLRLDEIYLGVCETGECGKSRETLAIELKLCKAILFFKVLGKLFIVELFLKSNGWMAKYYPKLNPQERYFILDLLSSNVSAISDDDTTKENRKCHISAIQFISGEFCSHSDHILDPRTSCIARSAGDDEAVLQDQSEVDDPCEISKWLELLSSASGNEEYLPVLQSDGPLLVQAVFLLKSMHLVGKLAEEEGDLKHPFAPIQKLSAVESSQLDCDVEINPVRGFKRNLIRLIGNLAWKNSEIQNKVLELECVPLILDCCNIDERNPFITQWAIMAIRNLCDGNHEVQNIIAGLKKEGVISCDILKEMGLTLHDSGNPSEKISIVPLPK